MKTLFTFIFFFAVLSFIHAQNNSLIQNIEGRKTVSLNGKWNIIIDPYETGYYNYRYEPDPNGYFKNAKPASKTSRVEYDFDKSETLNVPGDWNTQSEKLFFYEGTVWYKKSFSYSLPDGKRLFIYFGAVNYDAKIFVNGEKVGEHTGGFTPFNFEITDKIKNGENFVIVKADNKRLRDGVPTLQTDWWNYGGITRDVYLVELPEKFITDYFLQLKKNSYDTILGWVRFNGTRGQRDVSINIPELKTTKIFSADEAGLAKIEFPCRPELWSPENPKLYKVIIASDKDTVIDFIGFRNIETRGTDILLNGKPVFLRGISIHEEAPGTSSRAHSKQDAEKILGMAKELGCNFVRLAHYPHNENMIRAAERMGLLVWSEIPVYWTIQWENKSTFENASNQLSEMISRDKNRAPVILWSVGNETPRTEPRLKFMKALADSARILDSTRLITAATEIHNTDPRTIITDDPLGNYLDVLGCNEYLGWYNGLPDKADTTNWTSVYSKPLIISEFGGGAKYGMHGDSLTVWTEEYQENLYKHQIGMLSRISSLRGMTPWVLMDFRSPRRPLPGIQDFFNRKGLYSNLGEKKKAFYILQKYYESLKEK